MAKLWEGGARGRKAGRTSDWCVLRHTDKVVLASDTRGGRTVGGGRAVCVGG